MLVRGHVKPLRAQAQVRRRQEPQILPARIPHRPHRVGQAIRNLPCLTRLYIAHENGVIERTQAARVGHPLRVRAPHRIQRPRGHQPRVIAHRLRFPGRHIHHPHLQVGIGEEQLLRIGRPAQRVVVFRIPQFDFAGRRQPVSSGDHDAVFAGAVAEPGDVLAVRRPRRVPLSRPAGVAQIPHIALLRRNRKDLPARLHQNALARG